MEVVNSIITTKNKSETQMKCLLYCQWMDGWKDGCFVVGCGLEVMISKLYVLKGSCKDFSYAM